MEVIEQSPDALQEVTVRRTDWEFIHKCVKDIPKPNRWLEPLGFFALGFGGNAVFAKEWTIVGASVVIAVICLLCAHALRSSRQREATLLDEYMEKIAEGWENARGA